MHNKKILAKGLALGLVLSNTPIDSMANVIDESNINREEDKNTNLKKEEKEDKIIDIKEFVDDFFENLFNRDDNKLNYKSNKEVIKTNPNIRTGTVLEITLSDGQFVEDLSGNPGGYETVRVTTTGTKKLTSADYTALKESGIPKVDLSNAQSESIPAGAFKSATHLTEFKFPQGITSIGTQAFEGCSGFTGSLTIPNSVTTIGNYAFSECSGFTGSLTIPNSVTTIGDSAFSGCSRFTGSLTIPNSVTTIGREAFRSCSGLTGSLTIPNSVTTIGDWAFYGCIGFTGSLIIPDSVTSIGGSAFRDCSGFNGSLTIPNSVTTIGGSAFQNCRGFTGSLTIPNSVTSIGNGAFWGCSGFTGSLTIPNSVTTIGGSAFRDCSGFNGSLTIPNSVTTIGGSAFRDCSGFNGSLTIPNSVTSIWSSAFSGCSGFTGSLTIPNSVTTIEESAFYGCSGIDKIIVGVNESHISTNYKKDIIENLPVSQTYIELSYNLDIAGTWLETTTYTKAKPTMSTYAGKFENNEGMGVSLDIIEASDIKTLNITKDGEVYNIEKNENGKYVFTEEGNYQIYVETELGAISNIEFRNNSPVNKPSLEFNNNVLNIINNGILSNSSDGEIVTIDCDTLEYRIDGGDWQAYTDSFELNYPAGTKVQVEVRASHDGFASTILSQEVTVELNTQEIEEAIEKAEQSKNPNDVSDARDLVNQMPESSKKDEFQGRLDSIFPNLTSERESVTSNVDLYIKSENMLRLTLSTNSITFDDFSGVDDMVKENAINLTINSSLPYKINAYMPTDIENADGTNIMNKEILNIRANGESTYNTFVDNTTPIVLLDDQPADNDVSHGIDLMLKGRLAHEKDIYKTTIKFEVEQK